MPEHLIRLRGPWDLIVEADGGVPDQVVRIVLPADRLPASDRPLRLRRRFGRPARLPSGLPCLIRTEDVPGLLRMTLNGNPLTAFPAFEEGGTAAIDVPVDRPIRPRNVLELTIAPGPSRGGGAGRPWGAIALVFEPDDAPPVDAKAGPTR